MNRTRETPSVCVGEGAMLLRADGGGRERKCRIEMRRKEGASRHHFYRQKETH